MATDSKGWKVYRKEWYNDRIMETYINAPIIDKQNDLIPTNVLEDSMDFYMKYGVYSYQHEEIPIGLPLAYKIDDGKIKVKYGIHNQLEMHDNVWKEIKDFGTKGASSIRGETLSQDMVCPEGADSCFNKINDLGLWSVSWVGDNPANVEATVTDVAMAKADKGLNFINESNKIAVMAKKDADCECTTEKAEETEVVEEPEVKSEEVSVEVIEPEELPDVVDEEEVKEDEPEELTLEMLAEEMKAMRAKLDEMTPEEEKEDEMEEEAEKSETETEAEPSLEVVMKSLKKYGISVYTGTKATPAPVTDTPKVESFDWNNVSKSWDELEEIIGDN
jgi:hypothetical protein|tara:strand:- start:186 stop:1184 length:999 start_codon:yes stop_codon:yes gene_type:complete